LSQEQPEEKAPRIKVYIELGELSSKQRGSVLGLIKDMGFTPDEIAEVVVRIPGGGAPADGGRRQKRK
jgi:hypothetical protein